MPLDQLKVTHSAESVKGEMKANNDRKRNNSDIRHLHGVWSGVPVLHGSKRTRRRILANRLRLHV